MAGLLMKDIYCVTACTPEDGRINYHTLSEKEARRIHSLLMRRQLDPNDMTHDVRVLMVDQ